MALQQPKQFSRLAFLWLLTIAIATAFLAMQLLKPGSIDTDLRSISASGNQGQESAQQAQLIQQAISAVEARTTRTLVIKIGPHAQRSELQRQLNKVQQLTAGWAENQLLAAQQHQAAQQEYFYQWRYQLADAATVEELQALTPSELARRVVRQLSLPTADKRDWLNIQRRVAEQTGPANNNELQLKEGALWINKENQLLAILVLQLRSSAFATDTQQRISDLKQSLASAKLPFEFYGPAEYASAAAATAKFESTILGGLSIVAILLLSLLAYRSLVPIMAVVSTVAISVIMGLFAVITVFGSTHVLTLLLGVSLIGMTADYVFHLVTDWHRHGQQHSISQIVGGIRPGIVLAMLSTCLGYSLLIGVQPELLTQLAIFTIAGLLAATVTSLTVLPYCLQRLAKPSAKRSRLFSNGSIAKSVSLPRKFQAPLILVIAAAAVISLSQLEADNDPRGFYAQPDIPSNKQAQATASGFQNQFLLVHGDSEQDLLKNLSKVEQRLEVMRQAGGLGHYYSINRYFQANRQQLTKLSAFTALFDTELSHWPQTLTTLGVNPEAIETERQIIQSGQLTSIAAWLQQPSLGKDHDLVIQAKATKTAYASIILLAGASTDEQLAAIRAITNRNPKVAWVDSLANAEASLSLTQLSLIKRLALALLAISLLLLWRYKHNAWRVIAVPLIAAAVAVISIRLMGNAFSLFHMAGFLVILALALDYGVFFAEAKPERQSSTQLAVCLSAITTLFGFGILLLSSTPAVAWFGGTVFVGVIAAVLAALMLRPQADEVRSSGK